MIMEGNTPPVVPPAQVTPPQDNQTPPVVQPAVAPVQPNVPQNVQTPAPQQNTQQNVPQTPANGNTTQPAVEQPNPHSAHMILDRGPGVSAVDAAYGRVR